MGWIGVVALPLCWLLFCVDFTGSWSSIRSARALALLASPAIALFALLSANRIEPVESMVAAAMQPQPTLLALSRLYGWLLFLLGMALLVRRYARSASVYRAQCGSLILAGSIPAAVHLLHLLGFDPLDGVDPTLFSFNAAALVLGWGLFSYRLFDVTPIAYETVFNAIGDGVVVTDSHGQVTSVNPIALETLGRGLDDVLGKKIDELFAAWPQAAPAESPSQRGRSAAGQLDPTAGGPLASDLIQLNVRRAGRDRDVEVRAFPVYDGERRLYGRVYISQDVTDRNAYQRRIEEMAYRDFLTKLPNRRALYADAQRAIAFARRRRQDCALLFFDLDDGFSVLRVPISTHMTFRPYFLQAVITEHPQAHGVGIQQIASEVGLEDSDKGIFNEVAIAIFRFLEGFFQNFAVDGHLDAESDGLEQFLFLLQERRFLIEQAAKVSDLQLAGNLFIYGKVGLELPATGMEVGGLDGLVENGDTGAYGLGNLETQGDPVCNFL